MMRLPRFRYLAPRALDEAAAILADLGPEAAPLAGGTDLLPNLKRGDEGMAKAWQAIGRLAVAVKRAEPHNATRRSS
jgi:hypothetical protein